jgi:hypothetical protein
LAKALPPVYGIAGRGHAKASVVLTGLKDLPGPFILPMYKEPYAIMHKVYSYFNDILFNDEVDRVNEVYGNVDPSDCFEWDVTWDSVLGTLNSKWSDDKVDQAVVDALIEHRGENDPTLLILWDDSNSEAMETLCSYALEHGVKVLDLANGLAPIALEEEEQAPEQKEEEPEEEHSNFTHEELVAMPLASLKRMATALGHEIPSRPSKEHLAEMISGEPTTEEVAVPAPKEEKAKTEDAPLESNVVSITVVYDNGATVVLNASGATGALAKELVKAYLS